MSACTVVPPPSRPARWRTALAAGLFALFHALPWLQHDGQPLLLLDLANRQAILLGLPLGADALPALLALTVAALAALYLLTHLAGRLWCGLLCPQTVLGTLHRKLPSLPAPLAHSAWAVLALWTGLSFIGYFTPIRGLLPPGDGWNAWTVFWAALYALATWANIAWLGNRVCTELCPFARLQPTISDAHTPHVRYLARRGEPRGARPPGSPGIAARGRPLLNPATAQDYVVRAANPAIAGAWPRFAIDRLGDCLDCGQCVASCPQALDIRNGVDARCLDCGLCIDACNQALATHQLPGGLIGRHSDASLHGLPRQTWRPRGLIAGATLLAAGLSAAWLLAMA